MRILLFFDGSRSSITNILAACQKQWQNTAQASSTKILISTFECLPEESKSIEDSRRDEQATEAVLEQGIKLAQNYGFNNFCGEIVCCFKAEVAQALAERANNWQADVICLPSFYDYSSPLTPFNKLIANFRWGFGSLAKSFMQPEPAAISDIVIPFSQIDLKQLMKLAYCPIVLTNSKGIEMKITYDLPAESLIDKDKLLEANEVATVLIAYL